MITRDVILPIVALGMIALPIMTLNITLTILTLDMMALTIIMTIDMALAIMTRHDGTWHSPL
jgi:hypothetical protein